jgi:3-oxoacyl-ACP reductase-like protein
MLVECGVDEDDTRTDEFAGYWSGNGFHAGRSANMQLDRKTVVVTGASKGIGAGIVKAFLARGYDVVGTVGARRNRRSFRFPITSL